MCAIEGEQAVPGIGTGRMGSGEAQLQPECACIEQLLCQPGLHVNSPEATHNRGLRVMCQRDKGLASWNVRVCACPCLCALGRYQSVPAPVCFPRRQG